jgi:hypothetical protein
MAYMTSSVQTPDVFSTALNGSAAVGLGSIAAAASSPYSSHQQQQQSNINPPAAVFDEATALMFAAERGAVRSVQAWMARGGDINGTLVQQVRPVERERESARRAAKGHRNGPHPPPPPFPSTPHSQAGGSYTPLQLAAYTGHAIAVRTLLACGADPSTTAASLGSSSGIYGGGRGGAAAAAAGLVGHLPLHLAARYGHSGALEALLEAGVDPNAVDEVRRVRAPHSATPPLAAQAVLLISPFSPHPLLPLPPPLPPQFAQSALHYAAAFGHLPCVTALARYGADVYAAEAGGRTACELAQAAGQAQVGAYLRRTMEAGGTDSGTDARAYGAAAAATGGIPGAYGGGPSPSASPQQAAYAQSQQMQAYQQQQAAQQRAFAASLAGPIGGTPSGFDYGVGGATLPTQAPYPVGGGGGGGGGYAFGVDAGGYPAAASTGGGGGGIPPLAGTVAQPSPGRPGAGFQGPPSPRAAMATAAAAGMSGLTPIPLFPQPQQPPQSAQPGMGYGGMGYGGMMTMPGMGMGATGPPLYPQMGFGMGGGSQGMGGAGMGGMTLTMGGLAAPTLGAAGIFGMNPLQAQLAQLQLAAATASAAAATGAFPGSQPAPPMQQLLALQQQQAALLAATTSQAPALPPLPSIPPARARLRDWLLSIGMSEYYPAFLRQVREGRDGGGREGREGAASFLTTILTHDSAIPSLPSHFLPPSSQGYDDIDFIFASGGLTDADCAALGIMLSGHRRKVMGAYGLKPYTSQGVMERHAQQVQAVAAAAAQQHASQLAALQAQQQQALAAMQNGAAAPAADAGKKGGKKKKDEEEEEEEDDDEDGSDDDDDDEDGSDDDDDDDDDDEDGSDDDEDGSDDDDDDDDSDEDSDEDSD